MAESQKGKGRRRVRGPLAQFRTLRTHAATIGWSAAFWVRLHDVMLRRLNFKPALAIQLKPKNAIYSLRMRTGKSSDREVLGQIFINSDYEAVALTSPLSIIDLGANVGYTSAYFLSRYPLAKVLAVEPDPDNFLICQRNLAPFGARATVLHGAAWSGVGSLAVKKGVFGDGREWATMVCAPTEAKTGDPIVQAYDIDSLIALTDSGEIDLLKIDIEGSERELFSRNTAAWLPKVKNICIELHGEECASAFFAALSEFAYEISRSGELTICNNLRRLSTDAQHDACAPEATPTKK